MADGECLETAQDDPKESCDGCAYGVDEMGGLFGCSAAGGMSFFFSFCFLLGISTIRGKLTP